MGPALLYIPVLVMFVHYSSNRKLDDVSERIWFSFGWVGFTWLRYLDNIQQKMEFSHNDGKKPRKAKT